jgi:hypothetical protein
LEPHQRSVSDDMGTDRYASEGNPASTPRPRRKALLVVLGLLAGALLTGGAFMDWLIRPGGNFSLFDGVVTGAVRGAEFLSGKIALGAGIGAIILTSLMLTPILRRSAGLLLVVVGVVSAGFALYFLTSMDARLVDHATEAVSSKTHPEAETRSFVEVLIRTDRISADPGIGLYVSTGGSILAIVAGAAAMATGRPLSRTSGWDPD